jgi:hypothetical protein
MEDKMKTQFIWLAVIFVLLCPFASAQWVKTNCPDFALCFAVSQRNLFAGTSDSGVYLSTNNGTSWTSVNNGLPRAQGRFLPRVSGFAVIDTNIIAGGGGVFLSTNSGANWTWVNNSLNVMALAVSGTNLFAGTYNKGVFLSADGGTSWAADNGGLTKFSSLWGYHTIGCFASNGENVFIGTTGHTGFYGHGVFLSTNNGTNWTAVNEGLPSYPEAGDSATFGGILCLAVSGSNIFAGTGEDGVYHSTDNGAHWTAANTGLTDTTVNALVVSGTNLFAGTNGGVFLSTNNGTSWTAVNGSLTDHPVSALAVSGDILFVGTPITFAGDYKGGVWRRPLSEMVTSVEHIAGRLPRMFELCQNYPNPLNPSTTIKYNLPKSAEVRLGVYDVLGREVSMLVNEKMDAGVHEVKFEASDLSSGLYFYRLSVGDFVQSKKLMILK